MSFLDAIDMPSAGLGAGIVMPMDPIAAKVKFVDAARRLLGQGVGGG